MRPPVSLHLVKDTCFLTHTQDGFARQGAGRGMHFVRSRGRPSSSTLCPLKRVSQNCPTGQTASPHGRAALGLLIVASTCAASIGGGCTDAASGVTMGATGFGGGLLVPFDEEQALTNHAAEITQI